MHKDKETLRHEAEVIIRAYDPCLSCATHAMGQMPLVAELYGADEVFMCGTAAEVVPVREIDEHPISDPGPITLLAQEGYESAIFGRDPRYADWLDPIGDPDRSSRPDTVES